MRRDDPLGAPVSGNAKLPGRPGGVSAWVTDHSTRYAEANACSRLADSAARQFGGLIVSLKVGIAHDSRWTAAWRDRLTQLNVGLALVRRIARAGISKVVSPGV